MLLSARLRGLGTVLPALVASRADVSRLDFRVHLFDVDLNRHLTNSRYNQLMDVGRLDLLTRSRLLVPMLRSGTVPMAVGIELVFRRELPLGQRFVLETRVTGEERRAVLLRQRFLVGDREHAVAVVKMLCVRGGRAVAPDLLRPLIAGG